MKGKLLWINACIRKQDSRTLKLSGGLTEALSKRYSVEEIDLTSSALQPITAERYRSRNERRYEPRVLEYAEKFAAADRVVIAAPFWDMSFPSVLKVFFENISINGITFADTEDGRTRGLCAASKMLLITTRGMEIEDESPLDQASSYLRALCWLWGIDEYRVLSAIGMDVCEEGAGQRRLEEALKRGLTLCEEF